MKVQHLPTPVLRAGLKHRLRSKEFKYLRFGMIDHLGRYDIEQANDLYDAKEFVDAIENWEENGDEEIIDLSKLHPNL